jgi:Tfp pilus assembly protein PilN
MPQINLLLTASSKKKKAKALEVSKVELTKAISIFLPISYVAVAILVLVWLIFSFLVMRDKRELAILDQKKSSLTVSPQEIQQVALKKEQLNNKMELLENFSSRKFIWSEKLEKISEFLPDGIWLTEISLDQLAFSSSEEKKDKEKIVLLNKFMLTIKGSAYAYKIQDAVSSIGKFNNLMKETEEFSKDFSEITLFNVAKASIGKTDVMNFEFNLMVRY